MNSSDNQISKSRNQTKTMTSIMGLLPTNWTQLWTELSLSQSIYSLCFYLMITICVAQTFYPLFMITNMWLRRANIFYHYFHKVIHFSYRFLISI